MQISTYRLHFISAILAGAFSLCGCGGPFEYAHPSDADGIGSQRLTCSTEPQAPNCTPGCEEMGNCSPTPASVVFNGSMSTTYTSAPPPYWASLPNFPCGIGGWGDVAHSSTDADPSNGGGWSVKFPAKPYADGPSPCAYYTEFEAHTSFFPAGYSQARFSMDALAKAVPTLSGIQPTVHVGVVVRWLASDCTVRVSADTQFFPPDTQWTGANPDTNTFGSYNTALSVPPGTACVRVTVRSYYTTTRDLYVDNVALTPQ